MRRKISPLGGMYIVIAALAVAVLVAEIVPRISTSKEPPTLAGWHRSDELFPARRSTIDIRSQSPSSISGTTENDRSNGYGPTDRADDLGLCKGFAVLVVLALPVVVRAGGERTACALRFVAFDAFDHGMFAGQGEFRVSIVNKLELADGPGGWDGMALNAPGIQLASVRVFVTICAF